MNEDRHKLKLGSKGNKNRYISAYVKPSGKFWKRFFAKNKEVSKHLRSISKLVCRRNEVFPIFRNRRGWAVSVHYCSRHFPDREHSSDRKLFVLPIFPVVFCQSDPAEAGMVRQLP